MAIVALSAALSSFAGLYSLAVAAGWQRWLAPLLPLTVDVYAAIATRVWLAGGAASASARHFARWNALLAVGLSLTGNGVWHLAEAGLLGIGWPVVLATGSVPPLMLGLLSHLAVLHGQDGPDVGTAAVLEVGSGPEAGSDEDAAGAEAETAEDGLLAAARAADAEYRASHDGRPITRDALRRALGISTERAGEVLRAVRHEQRAAGSQHGQ
ncbi:hypothetical protein BCD48_39690 [Pseudofrankia sp. BMG5.36]|nr:hypothetical protein BCD48_39690 [Pseudofrankia sp. BMG5.36]